MINIIKKLYFFIKKILIKKMNVYWCYCKKYSETCCVTTNLEYAIQESYNFTSFSSDEAIKSINENGEFETFQVLIKKINFYGPKNTKKCYILRYPNLIFTSYKKALLNGLIEIIKNKKLYYWSINNDFSKRTRTICNYEWVNIILKTNFDNSIEFNDILNILCKNQLEELWYARIKENEWSCENHIEYTDKIFF